MNLPLQNITHAYFIGIGGIGMSALARWFKASGREVAGYDRTETKLTKTLESEGIAIHFEDDISKIDKGYLELNRTLVVYTPAIPKDHKEFNYLNENGFNIKKRAEVLGLISNDYFTIAVAGTHGKTSTTSIVAHILKESDQNFTAFLGGIAKNFNSNFLANKAEGKEMVLIEADEYDRSFLTLSPDLAIITTVEADHLDIYGDEEGLKKSFNDFVAKVNSNGKVFVHNGIELENLKLVNNATYGIDNGDFKASKIAVGNAKFNFDVKYKNGSVENLSLAMPGYHNVANATAAVGVAKELGIEDDIIKNAIGNYQGVKRRFEFLVKSENKTYIDDYAHHPTEIEAFIKSVKALYPGKELTVVFQPHLFSRTKDFADGFAESLSLADRVILLEIYPARELPIEGVDSKMLLDKISIKDKSLVKDDELLDTIKKINPDILATVGAGNIDRFIEPIANIMEN